ncbi:hypothetical protein [Sena Madureira virus]|uniref:Uncharacterized protein n=1 Tax=Sena Madureira virus TaxID=1272957 RepID=A0A0D3R155_9RHAB|nr:hypothetical protein [Sena Madureira virus]AJR28444.1 hypothetical protein [Sena Madureira virus]
MDLSCWLLELFKLLMAVFFISPVKRIFIGTQLTILVLGALLGLATSILGTVQMSSSLSHIVTLSISLMDTAVTKLSGFRSVLNRGIGQLILNSISESCQ